MPLEKILEIPLDCKIRPVNPEGNQSLIFIGKTDAEAKALILWLPDVKSQLIEKDPVAGKDWGQEKKGMTEDEMVGWLHRLHGHESEQAWGNGERQGSLACCSSWACKELYMTEWPKTNWKKEKFLKFLKSSTHKDKVSNWYPSWQYLNTRNKTQWNNTCKVLMGKNAETRIIYS